MCVCGGGGGVMSSGWDVDLKRPMMPSTVEEEVQQPLCKLNIK